MNIKNSLDVPLSQIRGVPSVQGDVGIELELEAKPNFLGFPTIGGWHRVHEESLRNGTEYVLRGPMSIESVEYVKATKGLGKFLEKNKEDLRTSIRTSLHVHVNVSRLSLRQIYNIIGNYYLIEDSLLAEAHSSRRGNLFCMTASNSEGIFDVLYSGLSESSYFNMFSDQHYKYCALNLGNIMTLGSVEFRFMEASLDIAKILEWTRRLKEMVYAMKDDCLVKKLEENSIAGSNGMYVERLASKMRSVKKSPYIKGLDEDTLEEEMSNSTVFGTGNF